MGSDLETYKIFSDLGDTFKSMPVESAQMKEQVYQLREQKRKALEQEQGTKALAAELENEEGGIYSRALEAGASPSEVVRLRQTEKLARFKIANSPSRYKEDPIDAVDAFTKKGYEVLSSKQEAIEEARKSGDKEKFLSLMDDYNNNYKFFKETVNKKLIPFQTKLEPGTVGGDFLDGINSKLADLDPDKLALASEAVEASAVGEHGLDKKLLDDMEDSDNLYGMDIDFSDIPDRKSLTSFAWAATKSNDIDDDDAIKLVESRDIKALTSVANNDSISKPLRIFAGALVKFNIAGEFLTKNELRTSLAMPSPEESKVRVKFKKKKK